MTPCWRQATIYLPQRQRAYHEQRLQEGDQPSTTTRTLPRSCLEIKPIPLVFSALLLCTIDAKLPKSCWACSEPLERPSRTTGWASCSVQLQASLRDEHTQCLKKHVTLKYSLLVSQTTVPRETTMTLKLKNTLKNYTFKLTFTI